MSTFKCRLPQLLHFFPLHFSLTSSVPPSVIHCSAHPPFSLILSNCSTHKPTFQHVLYHAAPPPLLFSFHVLKTRFITPLSTLEFTTLQTLSVSHRRQKLYQARAVGSVYSYFYVSHVWVFFTQTKRTDTLNYSLVGHIQTKDPTDKETILIVPERKSLT